MPYAAELADRGKELEGRFQGTFERLTQHLCGNTKKADKQPDPVASRKTSKRCNHSTAKSDHNNTAVLEVAM